MPTQPTDDMPSGDQDNMRFRADTLEEAIAVAEQSLGSRVRVVAANRIRRGGIGGFFASDLGVEVTVALDDETIEQALERLVAETAADEREEWFTSQQMAPERRTESHRNAVGRSGTTGASTIETGTIDAAVIDAGVNDSFTRTQPEFGPDVPFVPYRTEAPTMVRVEQIIQELQHLTAAPLFNAARTRFGNRTTPLAPAADVTHMLDSIVDPLLQPSTSGHPLDSVVASMVDVLDVAQLGHPAHLGHPGRVPAPALPVVPATSRCTPTLPPRAVEIALAASARAAQAHAAQVARSEPQPEPQPQTQPQPQPQPQLQTPERHASSSPPSRRQVELAVAATDQLIESLKGEEGVKRLSVRVILRTGDQREVEATAEWEAS